MGMLIDGTWQDDADRSMRDGAYRRESGSLPQALDDACIDLLLSSPERFVLVASASCPWSHATVLARLFKGFAPSLRLHLAGGPRVEGYALRQAGPLEALGLHHVHQLYTATHSAHTGRATVPVLWDTVTGQIVSNESEAIMRALDHAQTGETLYPSHLESEIKPFLAWMFDGLSNAVYRAGKAQKQDEYEDATRSVYETLESLETRLAGQRFLFGETITAADLRLFATLVRYDTVYATHFRCTRYRLTDFEHLWRFTRRIYQMPGVAQTVDFQEILRGYYLNDGSHNPFKIVADQPSIDWLKSTDL